MPPKRIIIDTDPGIDDACAILLALASPEVSLEGLSIVHGNCSLEQGTINALSVLELAHAGQIPVAKGCKLPLVQPSLLAPELVEREILGGLRQPGGRVVRHTAIRPCLQGAHECFLHHVFRELQLMGAEMCRKRGDEFRTFEAKPSFSDYGGAWIHGFAIRPAFGSSP